MKIKVKKVLDRVLDFFAFFMIAVIIVSATLGTYYYANGYRINISNGKVIKTGVVSIESSPTKAEILFNNELVGKTPKSISSISEGALKIQIEKEPYRKWKRVINVIAEKSFPLKAQLILSNPKESLIHEFNETVVNTQISDNGKYIFILSKSSTDIISLYRYDIYRNFWDLSPNPSKIFTFNIDSSKSLEILYAPDGSLALVKEVTIDNSKDILKTYLLHTVKNGNTISQLNVLPFTKDYSINWANNSRYLILESEDDIITINTSNEAKHLILKKEDKKHYVWTTDTPGYFYTMVEEENSKGNYYTLIQTNLEGTQRKEVIKNIYTNSITKSITHPNTNQIEYKTFKSSELKKKFFGQITNFTVLQDQEGVIITTTIATYWYDLKEMNYTKIADSPSQFIDLSENKKMILIENKTGIAIFTFDKEENNPTIELGTKYIFTDSYNETKWLNNNYIIVTHNNELRIIDINGTNNYKILNISPKIYLGNNLDTDITIVIKNQIKRFSLN